jgi:hypothetical protein
VQNDLSLKVKRKNMPERSKEHPGEREVPDQRNSRCRGAEAEQACWVSGTPKPCQWVTPDNFGAARQCHGKNILLSYSNMVRS